MDPRVEKILQDERTRQAARGLLQRLANWWADRAPRRAERRARRAAEKAVDAWRKSAY